MPRTRRTILYIAHFDPTGDLNGAKTRLLEVGRLVEACDYSFVYVSYTTQQAYRIGPQGVFVPCGGADGAVLPDRGDVACIVYAWVAHRTGALRCIKELGLDMPRPPVVLDTIDSIAVRQYRDYKATAWQTPAVNLPMEREIDALDDADWLIAITAEERAVFAGVSETPCLVVSHSQPVADGMARVPFAGQDGGFITGFFGSQNYSNYHSAIRSCHVAYMSGRVAQFHIGGSICRYGALIDRMQRRYGGWLRVRGMVDTPAAFYEPLHFTTNILAYGSGIKIKVIESLCHGRPVVGNHVALEGLTDLAQGDGALRRAETYLEYRDVLTDWARNGVFDGLAPTDLARAQNARFRDEIRTFLDTVAPAAPRPVPYRFGRTRLRQAMAGITRSGGR